MLPVKPRITEIPGSPAIVVSPRIMLSNLVTLLVSTSHRPTMLRQLSLDVAREWFTVAMHDYYRPDDGNVLMNMFDAARSQDFKDPTRSFLEPYKRVIGALMADPDYVTDIGDELATQLIASGDWDVMHVTSPSLGYPRRYFMFKYEIGDAMPLFGTSFDIESVQWTVSDRGVSDDRERSDTRQMSSVVQMALARLCFIFDRVLMDVRLLPEQAAVAVRDNRDPFVGKTTSALAQRKRLAAVPFIYLSQYAALWPRLIERIDAYATRLAGDLYPRDAPALAMRGKVRQEALSRLPLHPLLATFASMFTSSLQMSTYFGKGECLVIPNTVTLPTISSTDESVRRSGLAQIMIAAALSEQMRLSAIVQSPPGESWVQALLGDVAPNLPREAVASSSAITHGTGFATLIETLIKMSRYVELLPTVVQSLGWSAAHPITLTEIETAGADFVLTDGDFMSDSAHMILAGMRVALPISNPMVMGFSRRFASDFNTGACYAFGLPPVTGEDAKLGRTAVVWSTLTCKGWMSRSDRDDMYARFYMPQGMLMGETGGEPRWNSDGPGISDPVGRRVAGYYKRLSSQGYVKSEAVVPVGQETRITANFCRYVTEWGGAVESATDPAAAQSELIATYGMSNVDRRIENLVYRESWNMRVPVRLARCNVFYWLNEVGNVTREEPFDGCVLFDDTLTLSHDVKAIDSLLSLVVVNEPKLAGSINDQVSSPE